LRKENSFKTCPIALYIRSVPGKGKFNVTDSQAGLGYTLKESAVFISLLLVIEVGHENPSFPK
jgi:hypothetical protein